MDDFADIIVPLSHIERQPEGHFDLAAGHVSNLSQISVLLEQAITDLVTQKSRDRRIDLVSATYDVAGHLKPEDAIQLTAKIERQTRTLIFASGLATQKEAPLVQATLIFRIS